MLNVEHLEAYYADVQALFGIGFEVREGEIVTIVGANAAGKSTTLQALSGLLGHTRGSIRFEGQEIRAWPAHRIVEAGIVHIPEGRRLFPFMSVRENLELGAYVGRARVNAARSLERVFTLLPRLRERERQLAGSLSGGEQQMVAIARGLMAEPRLLLLDEPTIGLAPMVVQQIFELLKEIRGLGMTILLVEQNVRHSLAIADRAYVLENGHIALSGTGSELLADDRLRVAYLGM